MFLIAAQAELTQTPFDMPVAESELVAGYLTEYSGFRFLLFFIGEFAAAGAFAALAATMFLGGWAVPFISIDNNAMNIIGPLVLFTKMMIIAFVFFWVRFTYPRFREDQLQQFAWKVLIPISLAQHHGHGDPQGGVLMARRLGGLLKGLGVTFKELTQDRRRRARPPCSTRTRRRRRPSGRGASSPSRRRTARSACCARAAAPTGASTSRATRRRRRRAVPAASPAR